jgi:hypothetical protein
MREIRPSMINVKKILKRSRREIAVMSTANPPVLLLKANVKEAVNSSPAPAG